nr:uncharacterized protein CI109_005790 [Kwoniella shandongensis]KAA5525908.1 hypothetical protein CI109_005790 [Kwoniella shandongensis]
MFMSGELYAQSYCGTMINSFSYAEFNAYVARIRACFAYGYEPHVELLPLTHEERLRGCPGQQQITLFRNWPFTPDELRRVESILPYGTSSGNPPFVILPEKPNSTSICFGQRKEFKPRQVHRLEKGLKKVFADIGGGPPTLISRPHNETLKVDPKIWSSDDHQGQAIHA